MATPKIVLFDIPSKEPNHAWSLNTWRTRLVLNYKGLDYETEWLEYPEIKPRLQPHFPDKEEFTVPTVKMPDGTYIMDSLVIAEELEKQYPSPNLHLDSPFRLRYFEQLKGAFPSLRPEFLLGVPNRLLKEVSHEYWHRTRTEYVGMPLEQFVREGGGEKAYKGASPFLQNITAMLKEDDEGPFFMGKTISYVDFTHAGFLIMFRRLGDDVWQQLLNATGDPETHLKFLEALKHLTERDNY
ncbi:putative glutathione S-transferase [Rosellinia necatrix]|uniref:Putative glutathione S-transferase n=1 Tax=Rosellinia necatrix TaxID=77044 RepID=A0A1W2TBK5_ROSNE|nr:putative glutathione S-transferase [Rosellinia necatrix]